MVGVSAHRIRDIAPRLNLETRTWTLIRQRLKPRKNRSLSDFNDTQERPRWTKVSLVFPFRFRIQS